MVDAIDEALVSFLYRWGRSESPLGFDIVDIDLLQEADAHPGSFADRLETAAALAELVSAVDSSTHPHVAAKIDACDAFLASLNGERSDFGDYSRRTLGHSPEMIDEVELQRQYDLNGALLDTLGYPHTTSGMQAWKAANRLPSDDVHQAFAAAETELLPAVKQAAGIDFDVSYRTEVVDEDAYWINWTTTDDRGEMLVRFNTNARHEWVWGHPDYLALHEVGGHALQMTSWKRSLQAGTIPRSAGLVTVFTPDMFLLEGLADTLPWFCDDLPRSAALEWSTNRSRLQQMAWNNGHIMANAGASEVDVLAYVNRWAPGYASDQDGKSHFDEAVNHSLLRGYLYSYGIGGWKHHQLASRLSPAGRRSFLARAYAGPMSAEEVVGWADHVK